MRIDSTLFRGLINKELRVVYSYTYEATGNYQTLVEKDNGNVSIKPSYALSISEGFEKGRAFIPSNKYFQFVTLLSKTVKLISEKLYEIFPDVNKSEFEIDSRTLERFQTEKAMSTAGMTMLPCVYVDNTNACFPGIKVETLFGTCVIPLDDAIAISQMLNTFDPNVFGLSILRIIGRIE